MVCIIGIKRSIEFLKHYEESTVTPPMPFNTFIPGGFMRYMPPASYWGFRKSMTVVFSDTAFLEARGESIGRLIRDTLVQMTERSEEIHPEPYFHRMAFSIFVELFVGISPHDREFCRLEELYGKIDYRRILFSTTSNTEKYLNEIEAIFLQRSNQQDSLWSHFWGNDFDYGSKQWKDKTFLRNFIYLLQTSWIDVADLFTWIFKLLSDNRRWLVSVRERLQSPAAAQKQAAHEMANRIVLETLRLEQSEYLMRKTLHDIHFEGFLIPKGWLVRLGIRESHRDGEIFTNPHDFNPDRFVGNPYGPKQYSPFGIQQKSCIGKGLTLWIAQKFVLELAQGFEWRVVQDGPRELGAFHWKPSSKLRVHLSRLIGGEGKT